MLILTRKTNESIQIGDNCKVTVIDIRGDRVRLGFDAPRTVHITRDDVVKRGPRDDRCPHPDTRFVEELLIHAEAGNVGAVMGKLLARSHGPVSTRRGRRERPCDPRDLALPELGLPQRIVNALESASWLWLKDDDKLPIIPSAGALCRWSAADLRKISDVGPTAVKEIQAALTTVGLSLR